MSSLKEEGAKGISRRKLLKGTTFGTTVLAGNGILAGCAPKAAETTQNEEQIESNWRTPPEPIPASQIIETKEAEAVVVGAGLSGVAAAVSAKENGADVIVIEKGNSFSARGGHFASVDSRLMQEAGVET